MDAAGLLASAISTGRILLCHRSPLVSQPNTWGIPAGFIEGSDSAYDTALREFYEETGCREPFRTVEKFSTFRSGSFVFTNFVGTLWQEFEPRLNWENDDFAWVHEGDALTMDLHFGTRSLLRGLRK